MPHLRADAALLAGFRRGERSALERVYWAYVDRVERILRFGVHLVKADAPSTRVSGAPVDEIGDLVQETFARAFTEKTRLAYDGLRDYGPFLATIARNLLIDRARKLGRELPLDAINIDDEPAPEAEAPYAEPAVMQAVNEYLAQLPDELRAAHNQRYERGLSQEDAARALGISRQQIRTLEKRLREGLAAYMAARGLP